MFGMLPLSVSKHWSPPARYERCIQKAMVALAEIQEKLEATKQLRKLLKPLRPKPTLQANQQHSETSDSEMLKASVDTALLHCLLLTSEDEVKEFLSFPNSCVLDDCERFLRQEARWSDIVALYRSKGMDRKALELLTGKARPYSSVPGAIDYLRSLNGNDPSQKNLILEFSVWVLNNAPHEQALQMFYNEKCVAPLTVLNHLRNTLPNDLEAHAAYTQKVLSDPVLSKLPDCKMSAMHETLIQTYVELLKNYEKAGKQVKVAEVGTKLQAFLKASDKYGAQAMKKHFNTPQFYKEMAILHSKLEEHEEALLVLSHGLKSIKDSVAYCDEESLVLEMGKPMPPQPLKGKDQRYELHFMLFRLLLQPSDKSIEPKVDDALTLLKLHADKINCLKALKMLPPHTKLHSIHEWIIKVLRDASIKQRETKVYMNLCKSEHHQVAVQRVIRQKEKCVVHPHTVCAVCKSKIGNSVIAYYPNKVLVHKSCATKQGGSVNVCPVTKRAFSPLDDYCK
eukprot:TRINITY_DN7995_c0_g2_i2.p1 TRINITY_DN7995_c0_g2~~TRINITY_DN7995_c0_g2_i2.p1  ORF type:complete len:510 (+),score=203.18 TRINITY_DN7995_c0_g2_i2:137-1666(+)